MEQGLIKAWFTFPEIRQNWFGFSKKGNKGRGLGLDFAIALNNNLYRMFNDFGKEKLTKGSHLEKLCLIKDNVGKDNISDFTTNLIHEYLLEYTQNFARKHIRKNFRKSYHVKHVKFNYKTETWEHGFYELPYFNDDYVLLTPKDLLTKDDTWINKTDLIEDFEEIPAAIENDQLRAQVNNYFRAVLSTESGKKPSIKEKREAVNRVINKYPEVLDYFIKIKESKGDIASNIMLKLTHNVLQ